MSPFSGKIVRANAKRNAIKPFPAALISRVRPVTNGTCRFRGRNLPAATSHTHGSAEVFYISSLSLENFLPLRCRQINSFCCELSARRAA
jgi:hypothetical protein